MPSFPFSIWPIVYEVEHAEGRLVGATSDKGERLTGAEMSSLADGVGRRTALFAALADQYEAETLVRFFGDAEGQKLLQTLAADGSRAARDALALLDGPHRPDYVAATAIRAALLPLSGIRLPEGCTFETVSIRVDRAEIVHGFGQRVERFVTEDGKHSTDSVEFHIGDALVSINHHRAAQDSDRRAVADRPRFAIGQRVHVVGSFGGRIDWPGTVLAVLDAREWNADSSMRWQYAVALDNDQIGGHQPAKHEEMLQQLRLQGAPDTARIFVEWQLGSERPEALHEDSTSRGR